ncbi:MAG: polysaccharide deacetylase family protein [Lewinellaceae bacterium]|nr:polysaccharide deacetylase family protein [Saprospiraceae bacterium]MCB9313744.1 polysaccharide deacetylase family protein [Lewinellaceae bacterium]
MYLVHTPQIIQSLFPRFTWRMPSDEKVVHLTFDDGPIPEVTPWVLEQLDRYDAKATFFCVGHNVDKHPDVYEQVVEAGHLTGNHTYHHLDGWNTDNITYFHNIRKAARKVNSNLFRPPYGRILPSQAQFLKRHYQVVLWDVLSGDFDPALSPEDCLNNVLRHVRPGSIVVFHDSLKTMKTLQYVLPRVLAHLDAQGYRFEVVPQTVEAEPVAAPVPVLQPA